MISAGWGGGGGKRPRVDQQLKYGGEPESSLRASCVRRAFVRLQLDSKGENASQRKKELKSNRGDVRPSAKRERDAGNVSASATRLKSV